MTDEGYHRKLTAILSADVVGYSRLMGEDEAETVKTITAYRKIMGEMINQHRGRLIDSPGDNILAEFASVVDAVQCAVAAQNEFKAQNAARPENRRMEFRIGVNLGDVIEEEGRIYGDGVNIAARLEALADPGGICISKTAFDHIETKLPLGYEYLGDQTVKNIKKPVGTYRVLMEPRVTVAGEKTPTVPIWRKKPIFAGAIVVVLLIIGLAVWHVYFRPPPIEPASVEKMAFPLPEKPSIAVLPFDNMSDDPKQEYFSDGMTEEIITALSKVPYLFVIARNSTFSYKGKPVKISQVAEELGVRYVLEGSVRRAKDKVRVTAQLIDAIKGHHLWAEHYERELKDTFALQDEITGNILSALAVKLTKGEQATIRDKGTDNLEAFLKFLQAGWYLHRMNKEGDFLARQLAEEAMALDPEYAGPYIILAYSHVQDVFFGRSKSRKESLQQALKLAQKAISLDDSFPSSYLLLSTIYMFKKQYERAIAEAERAIALDPNRADAYSMLGGVLHMMGRPQEAIAPLEKAIRINPIAPSIYFRRLGTAYRDIGRYEEAIVQLKKAISLSPDSLYPHSGLAATYSLADRDEEARAEASEVLRIQPKFSLDSYAKRVAFKNKADIDRIVGALRKVGLPDKPPLPLPDKPSIAVLPFENMSGDPEQEYFSDGITEEIITALSKTPKLFVIARNSTFTYKNKPTKVQRVGRELGVKYVLEGSVRKAGGKVRITAQLVDARTGNHLWAERYDRELKDIFAIQDGITKNIIAEVQVQLTTGEQGRMRARGTENLQAYLRYMQGREHFLNITEENNVLARQIFKEVIALDPQYAAAYQLLGATYWMDVFYGSSKSPKKSLGKAMELNQKAIELDHSYSPAHTQIGWLYAMIGKHEMAISKIERALELTPNAADAHMWMSYVLRVAGRNEEAIRYADQAMRLNPIPPSWYFRGLALNYLYAGRYDEAIAACKEGLNQAQNDVITHVTCAAIYGQAGKEEAARVEAEAVLKINPTFSALPYAKRLPYKKQMDRDFFINALRKAGLPE
jgi:adenylate cyclase